MSDETELPQTESFGVFVVYDHEGPTSIIRSVHRNTTDAAAVAQSHESIGYVRWDQESIEPVKPTTLPRRHATECRAWRLWVPIRFESIHQLDQPEIWNPAAQTRECVLPVDHDGWHQDSKADFWDDPE